MAFIKTHVACGACGSSDARSINADGSIFCFSCNGFFPADDDEDIIIPTKRKNVSTVSKYFDDNEACPVSDRRLTRATLERYGVVKSDKDYYFPYHDKDGTLVAAKVRNVAEKKFPAGGAEKLNLLLDTWITPRLHTKLRKKR